ncbi:hypothetical protein L2E82_37400 [Cichorium intybus]|uniref:Uncharacterized protein n=1 Tax=Cichorium intybus TaxID=13427 RepID=A0ACB9AIH7_CICIN|nr:hypothetical protein L2E82_37400 [Cichorium intybus]
MGGGCFVFRYFILILFSTFCVGKSFSLFNGGFMSILDLLKVVLLDSLQDLLCFLLSSKVLYLRPSGVGLQESLV